MAIINSLRKQFNFFSIKLSKCMIFLILCYTITEINCVKDQVADDQKWYDDEAVNVTNKNKNDEIYSQNDLDYYKLIQIQREIQLTESMIKLYDQRLKALLDLKVHIQSVLQKKSAEKLQTIQKQKISSQNEKISSKEEHQKIENTESFKDTNFGKLVGILKNSQLYIPIDKYCVNLWPNTQASQNNSQNHQNQMILLPPFVINKNKGYITQIGEFKQLKSFKKEDMNQESVSKYLNKDLVYEFAKNSKRLLFYWLQAQNKNSDIQYNNNKPTSYVLNMALEIKPNKIKSVKIIYSPYYELKNSSDNSNDQNKFQIQQQITSYESHELISETFRWHTALDFQNLIIGYQNQTVYIKSKDKRMHQIAVGSKILSLHSINQYKMVFVSQKKVGTINVRSLLISEQISFEYYLGNRTLMKQKQLEKRRKQNPSHTEQNQQQERDQQLDSNFWHSPYSKRFSQIRTIATYKIQQMKQILILLSNGDLLLYQKQKIASFTNLGNKLSKQFYLDSMRYSKDTRNKNRNENTISDLKMNFQLAPSFNHMIFTSNQHNLMLVFNVSIPNPKKSQGFSWFSWFSGKHNQFQGLYWLTIQLPTAYSQNQQLGHIHSQQISLFFASPQYLTKKTNSNNFKSPKLSQKQSNLIIFHCYYSQNNRLLISSYRLILNLMSSSSIQSFSIFSNSNKSQGRSYLWNIFMVVVIICGVLLFRKCKSKTHSPTKEIAQQESLNTKNIRKQKNLPAFSDDPMLSNKNKKLFTGNERNNTNSKLASKNDYQYNENIISQLQNYLEKQGQKLSKEQINQLIRDMQIDQNTHQANPTRMKRQQTDSEKILKDEKHAKQGKLKINEQQHEAKERKLSNDEIISKQRNSKKKKQ